MILFKIRIRWNCNTKFSFIFYCQNINIVAFSDIQFSYCFSNPFFRHFHFKNRMGCIHLHIVEDVIICVTDRGPLCNLLFRVNHFIRTIAQKEFFLNITLSPGYHQFRSQFFQKRSCFKRILKASSNGYKTDIVISYSKRTQKFSIGTITDLGIGHKW